MHLGDSALPFGLAALIDLREPEDLLFTIVCLLPLLVGAVGYYVAAYRREKRRTARFQAIAEQRGWHFRPEDDGSLF